MTQQRAATKPDALRWYVLTHLEPAWLEERLQADSLGPDGFVRYEYFIPFCFLDRLSDAGEFQDNDERRQAVRDNNSLRNTLRHFVFVRTTARGLQELRQSPWNQGVRVRLRRYLDREGRQVTVPDSMMQPFIQLICRQRLRFSIGLPIEEAARNDVVTIRSGAFSGQQAYIVDVLHTGEGISLTLGINMFGGTRSLLLPGYRQEDVAMQREVSDIIGDQFIAYIQSALLHILAHRVGASPADDVALQQDQAQLNHIFHYNYVTVCDPDTAGRFLALMLICAHLRYDAQAASELTERLRTQIDETQPADTELQAFQLLALYVATRRAALRQSVKAYVHTHPGTSDTLRRYLSLAKRLRSR